MNSLAKEFRFDLMSKGKPLSNYKHEWNIIYFFLEIILWHWKIDWKSYTPEA